MINFKKALLFSVVSAALAACNNSGKPQQPVASGVASQTSVSSASSTASVPLSLEQELQQAFLGTAASDAGGALSASQTAVINKMAADVARTIQSEVEQQNAQSSDPILVAITAEYRNVALKANKLGLVAANNKLKPLAQKLQKNAPTLKITAVSDSEFLPDFMKLVMFYDEASNQNRFAVTNLNGDYFIYSTFSWGKSFFNADGSPMTDNKLRAKVVEDFAKGLTQMREKGATAMFLNRTPAASKPQVNYYLLTDTVCADCLPAESFAQKAQDSDIKDVGLWEVIHASIQGKGEYDSHLPRNEILAQYNCGVQGATMDLKIVDGKRNWNIQGVESRDNLKVNKCRRDTAVVKAYITLFGIKPTDLPLIVSDNGLQQSGKISEAEFFELIQYRP